MFSSLSKRSNVPGMRSGFVAGDAAILKDFLLYRTYHGGAEPGGADGQRRGLERRGARDRQPPPVPREIEAVTPLLAGPLGARMPDASFYHWVRTPVSDTEFARAL